MLISSFLQEYETIPLELLIFTFNPPIMTLNILNYFSIQDLHTPELLNWNLGGIPGWIKCQSELETKGVRPQVPGR